MYRHGSGGLEPDIVGACKVAHVDVRGDFPHLRHFLADRRNRIAPLDDEKTV